MTTEANVTMASNERQPLLGANRDHVDDVAVDHDATDKHRQPARLQRLEAAVGSPANRILFAGFLVSLTLGLTQVPIIYVFRVMTCDSFYDYGPGLENELAAGRCSRREIDSATATQVSVLGMTTSLCGIVNLFICGALIKRWGTRWALVSQTSLLAVRVACQIVAVSVGGRDGIILMQSTQLIGIVGGPRGYMLVLNTAVAEVVERRKHTGVFGKLQGALMIGTAVGYLLGGVLGDAFGIRSPFIAAVACFVVGTVYGALSMPEEPQPEDDQAKGTSSGGDGSKGASGFFAPIKVLLPQRFRLESGREVTHLGLVFLAFGVFFGVFATGYAPILIQMYATSRFGFGTTENGILMSGNSWIRGLFLMFLFPRIIDTGRRWFAPPASDDRHPNRHEVQDGAVRATNPDEIEPVPGLLNSEEPTKPAVQEVREQRAGAGDFEEEEEEEDSTFDLSFLRWSLVVDGIVTSISAWATRGWHMYLAAFLLPFASGSAPAAKGVITEMCPPHMRRDALSAITLVESAATLTTQGLFGFIYASLSAVGKANLTFFCNGGLAVIAVCILMLAHYPPPNSTRVDSSSNEAEDQNSPEPSARA